jgi:4,5-dihydroxyphthalate decarboxylase
MTASPVPVRVALAPYHHARELVSGDVALAGMAPEFVGPDEAGVDIADLPLADYVAARLRGETELTAVPVFCARSFLHSWLHVADRPVTVVAPSATAAIYARAIAAGLPDAPPAEELLIAPPSRLAGVEGVRPLIERPGDAERAAFAETGVYPILSVLAIRTQLLERERWLVSNVYRAFEIARRRYFARLGDIRGSRAPIPSVAGHIVAVTEVLGPELAPSGLEPNRATLEAFLHAAAAQGAIDRIPDDIAELFARVEPFVDYTDGL